MFLQYLDKFHFPFCIDLDGFKVFTPIFHYCPANQGLPVGVLLLRYSVLLTVKFLSLLYLLFIS